uniref:non-specific serine/threonine protein kinase n=2 Tax=Oryza glumipatula TaxID=40148 RepID=A0A0D9YFW1_9ORYZ
MAPLLVSSSSPRRRRRRRMGWGGGSAASWALKAAMMRTKSSCRKVITLLMIALWLAGCLGRDSISVNESLSDGRTIVSMKNVFVLGFFSPGASNHRYIGIWHNSLGNKTIIWVGNRNEPLSDTSGVLMFDSNGNLVIVHGGRSLIVAYGQGAKDMKATILDSGNLVLSSTANSSGYIWQSFDSPTDTWLPEMKIGLKTTNQTLISWRSNDYPAMGDYKLGMELVMDPARLPHFTIWWRDNTFWTSGQWNGDMFSLIPELKFFTTVPISFKCSSNSTNDISCTYSANPSDMLTRIVLNSTGSLSIMQFDSLAQSWILLWRQPSTCEIPNLCGAFGVCNNNAVPKCNCTGGFVPQNIIAYSNGYTREGCIRQTKLQCSSDKFLEIPNVRIPDNRKKMPAVVGPSDCKLACLRNCSCTAYAYSQLEGCSLWYGDLMNLQDGYDIDGAGTLCLRLAASEVESGGNSGSGHKMLWMAGVIPFVALLSFCSLSCLLWRRRRQNKGKEDLHAHRSLTTLDMDSAVKLWESEEAGSQFVLFSFSQIAKSTNNFSAPNKLGEGGFGPVYKGNLPDGQDIAVKRLATNSGQGLVEFKNEVLLIAKLQHVNLVRLIGCCIQGEEKILIYEYMPNKSLDFFLFEKSRRTALDWAKRIHIIEGIAHGLLYLHKHSRLRIIHRDLKASNILLDIDMNPKISDFGMARIFGSKETQANTNRVVGTYGYMAPEYAMQGIFSVKSDVFSFGVLLLEIVSGTRNAGSNRRGRSLNLLGHAWELWREDRWFDLVDPTTRDSCPEHRVLRCVHVGLMCVQENAADRPTMNDVISMLTSESITLPDPKQPAFLSIVLPTEMDAHDESVSQNAITITDLEDRRMAMFGTRSYSVFGDILDAFLILLVLSTCCLSSTITTDSLLPNKQISDGQTIVSANETFTLGFFSPGTSTYRYVGIWYNHVPNRTVVWVANRNNPVLDTSGILMFDTSGNLVILDGRGSSFTVAYGSGAKDTEATILDSGNLVLRSVSNRSRVRWQSFDYPTDTWLQGMNLGFVGAQNQLLTSWRSSDDPAIGDYSFGMDPNEKGDFFIWERGNVYWKSGLWNGQSYNFTESESMSFLYVSNDARTTLSYSSIPASGMVSGLCLGAGQREAAKHIVHVELLASVPEIKTGKTVANAQKDLIQEMGLDGLAEIPGEDDKCSLWYGNIMNLREGESGDAVGTFYLRLAASELESRGTPVVLIAATAEKQRHNTMSQSLIMLQGNLPEGQEIAVKRLAAHSGQGLLEFKNEIMLIAKLQHRNLVRLLGCCIQGEEKILIYEYMPNKKQSRREMLDWATRITIIEGIAPGLLYLHKHSRFRIIHRDLKASNILLDIDMNPKISDFVLLLEIVSGIRNAGFHQRGNSLNLLCYAWELWKEGRWSELADPSIYNACPEHKESPINRPTMTEIISALDNESTTLPEPKQPAFVSAGIWTEAGVHGGTHSINGMTISDTQATGMSTRAPRSLLPLLFVAAAVAFFSRAATAADVIGQAGFITGNQTLVSSGGVFELGFFVPNGATDGRTYLGIWYASIPGQTVVWVANRQDPVVNVPAVARLSADGRLVIVDAKNTTVWSSPAPARNVTAAGATARLQDDGNLVVSSGSPGSVAWQSFDYPTDTLLPGMKLGVDVKNGITRNMTSWTSSSDPSPGSYTFKLVPGGLPEFFLFRGPTMIYGSGPWNGAELTGVPDLKSQDFAFTVVSSPDETYYSYSILNPSLLSRFVADATAGQVQRFVWINGAWSSFWYYPTDPCDGYAKCGAFGYCDTSTPTLCSCLPGFQPRSPQQWGLRDASGGCVLTANLTCGAGDGFWTVNRMKLPAATNATVYAGMTLDQCRQVCLGNCSCRAYAAANVSGGVSRGCVIWAVDLLDMRQYPGVVQDVYIRLAQSEVDALNAAANSEHPSNSAVIAVIATISGVLLLGAVGGWWFWRNRLRRRRNETAAAAAGGGDDVLPFRVRNQQLDVKRECDEKDLDLPLLDLKAIVAATDDFAASNKIGEGGFGPVYMGKLEDGQEVAVKRLSRRSVQGVVEFKNEVKLIAKLQHRNLVRLLGCCIDDDERMLVYEYMHNQSLDTFIFDEGKRKLLRWSKRFEIIVGVARGLLYLHEDSRFRIIHRDLKASNVLLDRNMVPKISDFGIARMFGGDQTTAYTRKVIGTYGYMSPEYAMDGLFSMKSDVYSFGVLVLEIVSGRRNRGFYEAELDLNLLRYSWLLWKEGRSVDLLDQLLGGSFDYSEVLRCIQVALLCVEVQPRNRPLMSSVVMMLASENATLPEPNEPGVNIGRHASDTESSETLTVNGVTITEIECSWSCALLAPHPYAERGEGAEEATRGSSSSSPSPLRSRSSSTKGPSSRIRCMNPSKNKEDDGDALPARRQRRARTSDGKWLLSPSPLASLAARRRVRIGAGGSEAEN